MPARRASPRSVLRAHLALAHARPPAAGHVVSAECKQEMLAFKEDRATNVNKDVPLARACRNEIKEWCYKVAGDPLKLMKCLRKSRKKARAGGRVRSWAFVDVGVC